jgi:hypothetical protein
MRSEQSRSTPEYRGGGPRSRRAGEEVPYLASEVTAEESEEPRLTGFLDLLENDIARNDDRIVATVGFARYLEELTAGIEVDYDAPIEGDFQL